MQERPISVPPTDWSGMRWAMAFQVACSSAARTTAAVTPKLVPVPVVGPPAVVNQGNSGSSVGLA